MCRFWEHKVMKAAVDSVDTDGSRGTAVVRATLTEAALLTDGCAVLDAADESYAVEYRLRRMGSARQWHIVAGRTL